MPRPRMHRRVRFRPDVTYYKPQGVPIGVLEEEILRPDELEALRLCDAEGLKQEDAAKKIGVSQPTLYRILNNARKKVANALIKGKAIRVVKA